uniref:Uncharacterized protein n=1 Tax=Lepeophtheirus salmonis TaxID=72036 RepID=A0A0K2V9N6_LEPSM
MENNVVKKINLHIWIIFLHFFAIEKKTKE